MKYKVAFLFTSPPYGSSRSREGIDALLAMSNYVAEEEILIVFMHDGVFNLLANQQARSLLQKDHTKTFKLIDLYELNHCYLAQESIIERGLTKANWLINAQISPITELFSMLSQAEKILKF